jgi:phosphatidylglycerophosphate synthase
MPTFTDNRLARRKYSMQDVQRSLTLPKTWWAFAAILPMANRVSLFCANKTRLTPNQITLISFVMVIAAMFCFIQGSWHFLVLGAVLYEFNYLLDCVDGTIAKMKKAHSVEGGFIDFFLDQWRNFIATFGLSYGHWLRHGDMTIFLVAMLYIFLEELYMLRDSKIDSLLKKDNLVFFTRPSKFLFSFAPAKAAMKWVSRNGLYRRPTVVEVDALVFFAAPLLNMVKRGMVLGAGIFVLIFMYHTIRFFVMLNRSRKLIDRLKSPGLGGIALFGSGAMALRFYDWALVNNIANKIVFAADNNKESWQRTDFPLAVVSPERLRKREFDLIVIASQHGYHEIAFQLGDMHLKTGRDFVALTYS